MAKINLKFPLAVIVGDRLVDLAAGVQDVADEVASAISPFQLAPLPAEEPAPADALAASVPPEGDSAPEGDQAPPPDQKPKKK